METLIMLNKLNHIERRKFINRLTLATLGVTASSSIAENLFRNIVNDKKLIFLYMDGGMSHVDTFDPHPGTAEAGPVKAINTNVDGIQLTEFMPNLANHMNNLSIIRSMYSTQGAHAQGKYLMHTGYQQRGTVVHPTLSSWSLFHQGKINPALPGNVVINPYTDYPYAGWMSAELGAVPLGDASKGLQNSNRPKWTNEKQYHDQLELARIFDKAFQQKYRQKSINAYNHFYDEALSLMNSEDIKAFDISKEPKTIRSLYGIESKFGQGCLLARRLIENGVRCVEVVNRGWDSHNTLPEDKIRDMDRGFSALLQDLDQRGLLQSTIVVLATEFGRTPDIKPETLGRDHWAKAFSCVIGGGGIKTGQVIGGTDRGHEVIDSKVEIPDLHTTIATAMGMPVKEIITSDAGRPFNVGYKGKVIPGLI